ASNSAGGYALAPLQGYVKESADRLRALVLQYGDKLAALGTTGNYDVLPLAKGGTGAVDIPNALSNLGLRGGANDLLVKSIGFRGVPVSYNVQGLYMGWNGNGDGGANYICNRGGGLGGHAWWSVNADNTAAGPVMTYSYGGVLTVSQVSTTVVSTNQINGLTTALTIAQGGTGANSQAGAQNALGLGVAQTPQFAGIELSAAAPYIDWHFANSTADYSVRMQIDSASSMGVSGDWGARSYWCKLGLNGARGGNRFNMNWTGSAMDLYVDASYVGSLSLFTSDYRIKKLIKDVVVPSFLDRIDAYRIVNFQKRVFGDVFRGDGTTYQGLIAHEAQAVNPLAVSGEKDGADADGNPIIQQLEPMALITDLMGAVKELRAESIELRAELAALKTFNHLSPT
ncbi:tail fiber domain-containing protein, partial [Pseudomonas amygdali]|uniref:tail fiber domain-containing protein n=1 Tax=Pseudomonas amygdali TaxID=47877 RepID=UPI0011C36D21